MLWIFGILLALTSAGGGGPANYQVPSGGGSSWTQPLPDPGDFNFPGDLDRIFPDISSQLISTLIALGVGLACFFLLLAVIGTIVRYVSETALIRLVDSHESSGEKVGFRQGWRMGWSRAALYIFLIDLLIGIISAVVFLLLFGFALSPLLLWLIDNTALRVVGTAASAGMGILVFFLAVVVGIIIALLIHFIRRACILEQLGVFEAIRRGIALVRKRVVDVFLMGVILFAVSLVFLILMIPVFIILAMAGVIIAGLPALLVGALIGIFMEGDAPWIVAAIIGVPLLMLIIIVPTTFLSGLLQIFNSSTWTLTYRELVALEAEKVGGE
jgi:hypothetical protein